MNHDQYFVGHPEVGEVEVTQEVYVRYERAAGFRPKGVDRGQPATAGFSNGGSQGRIKYRTCRVILTEEQIYAGREVDHSGCWQ